MRTVLICHDGSELHREGLARWLGSFSELAGIVVLREPGARRWQRVKREIRRVGWLRFLDVSAFRLYYRVALARRDARWVRSQLDDLRRRFRAVPAAPEITSPSVNSAETARFIREARPDFVFALCKTIIKPSVFTIPSHGTLVLHPGICPEYRNAHGCFWALANDDLERVGLTLLRIDEGVDTGPMYGHFPCDFDESAESHIVIQHRALFDNLDALRERVEAIWKGTARPIDATGRRSDVWGQPWLTRYVHWKRQARRRRDARRYA